MEEKLDDELLTFKDAYEFLMISPSTLRRWIADDKIPYHKAGRQLRFFKSELVAWLKEH